MSAFDKLIEQIDAFIRKFYKNEIIKGIALFSSVFLFTFLFTTSLEFFARFGSVVRALLFFSFIALNVGVLIKFIFIPLSKLFSFGKKINRYQASEIIGQFFPSISDRLLNTLQLNDSLGQNEGNFELIRASVAQRSASLSLVPFSSAINIGENKKYSKYLIPLLVLLFGIVIFIPSLLTQGAERVVNYSTEYKEEAPFDFVLDTKNLSVQEGDDLALMVHLEGGQFPDNIYLVSDQGKFLMTRSGKNKAEGVLKKLQVGTSFYFEGNDFQSRVFAIHVLKKSTIGRLQATLVYPSYLGRDSESISNAGDLSVPEGTIIEWNVLAKNTSRVDFAFNGVIESFKEEGFKVKRKVSSPSKVDFQLTNAQTGNKESSAFRIEVIKDAHPAIIVDERKDSISDGLRFFSGSISDDYGLTNLKFVYTIESIGGSKRTVSMKVSKVSGTEMPFDFGVDFRRENVKIDDKIEYYFVVTDNDGVRGNKSTKSMSFVYKLPSLAELNEKRTEEQEAVKESLETILKRTEEFQKNVDRLKKDLLNSKGKDFNKMNQIQNLQKEQEALQKSLESLQKEMDQSVEEKNELSEIDKDLLEKQALVDDLLEELMDDELKELLEKLEKLMNRDSKEDIKENLENVEQSAEEMKKQLDRSLEMLKKLQLNEKIDDVEKELKELAKEQELLKEEVEKSKLSKEDALKKQEGINQKFEDLKKKLDELEKLNESLDKPMELGNQDEKKQQISQDLKESSKELGEGKSKKAGEKQKSAAEQMEAMAEELDKKQKEANKQEAEEDINTLRGILKNLVSLSFEQESVMNSFSKVSDTDPAYRKYGRKQRTIVDESKIIKDSLEALAVRQPKIASFIDKELSDIRKNFAAAIEDVDEHRKRDLAYHQQSTMTSFNNLALLLNEALESMQSDMKADSKPGSGSCDNPGGKGKPKPGSGSNPGDMKQMLKKQLEQLEKGSNPGGKKPGDKEGNGSSGLPGGMGNKEIAKMAAEQGAMRRKMEELRKELNKDGKGSGNKLSPLIEELEKQEKDLINKKFSADLIKRQKNIMTRLLESEKALMERGFEEKRESKEGKNLNLGNQIRFEEYTKSKLNQIELLRSVDPLYRKYYKDKANEYFNRVN